MKEHYSTPKAEMVEIELCDSIATCVTLAEWSPVNHMLSDAGWFLANLTGRDVPKGLVDADTYADLDTIDGALGKNKGDFDKEDNVYTSWSDTIGCFAS